MFKFDQNKCTIKIIKTDVEYFAEICPNEEVDPNAYENVPFLATLRFLIDKANGINNAHRDVKHVVIDEAQDYTEPYIFFLRNIFPNATFTILGDKNQNVNPYFAHNSLKHILPNAQYFEMNKAYRSSPEIIKYCNQILDIKNIEAARRSQDIAVSIDETSNIIEYIQTKIDSIASLGFQRFGIITKNQDSATKLQSIFSDNQYIILPVYQAKGLEFDAAIVIDEYARAENELFYTACTRAQHYLAVVKIRSYHNIP